MRHSICCGILHCDTQNNKERKKYSSLNHIALLPCPLFLLLNTSTGNIFIFRLKNQSNRAIPEKYSLQISGMM